jgi:glycosyltransferase involved in cell wall biosynthesis
MDFATLTFVILTKNEQRNIAECAGSIPHGAQALVFDAESVDETRAIAKSCGATVATAPWRGIAWARDAAEQLVRTEWLFMLDADERVSPQLREELASLQTTPEIDAYEIPRENHFCGRWVRGAAWWPDLQIRMYRKGKARQASLNERAAAAGHIYYEAPGRTRTLRSQVIHYSYDSIDDYRRRFARYTDLEARARRASLPEFAAAWLVMPLRALWLLVWRRGFLDGWRGVYVSVASALYPAVVVTKALATRVEAERA